MVQLPATAAIEYVAACCRTRTRTKTKTGTKTKTVRGAYARSPQVQCIYAPSRLSVPSIVAGEFLSGRAFVWEGFCPGGLLPGGTFVWGAYARSPQVQCVYAP